ncbi:MAG TPA: sigma-54 dependent transcriptional regulator [Kofleriaceae bacterium]|nr:sigma-54 dependent transcriptional regulator [Kofleriaceae bacterium]
MVSAITAGVRSAGRDRVLIVDDDSDARLGLAHLLRDHGFRVDTARDGFKALRKLADFAPDLLVTDLRMPGMDGLALVRKAREIDPDSVAIVMTAYGAVDSALDAIREGAADYVLKPFRSADLLRVVEPALARRRLRRAAALARGGGFDDGRVGRLMGASPVMTALFETLVQVAPSRASVLLTGESGTGKELVARALHELSARAAGPFVTVHAAALAETLLESELFGHERGAFTGAAIRREGRFHQAHGGTLFLDEIGDLSLVTQVKLLRFLQEREFERVGGNQTVKVDVRVVAATNADLRGKVAAGLFREDLLYRLNVIAIAVPPLRVRSRDVLLLAAHFLARFAGESHRAIRGFTPEAIERLTAHDWPGNVRELENAIERAVVVCRGAEIGVGDLPPELTGGRRSGEAPAVPGATLADVERYTLLRTLEHTGGSTSRAAEILGVSTRTVQKRLRRYLLTGTGSSDSSRSGRNANDGTRDGVGGAAPARHGGHGRRPTPEHELLPATPGEEAGES